jgi:hypothetical protein
MLPPQHPQARSLALHLSGCDPESGEFDDAVCRSLPMRHAPPENRPELAGRAASPRLEWREQKACRPAFEIANVAPHKFKIQANLPEKQECNIYREQELSRFRHRQGSSCSPDSSPQVSKF